MKITRVFGPYLLLFLSYTALGESAVSKFWNSEFEKNLGCGPGNYIADNDSWLSTYLASSTNLTSTPFLPLSTTSGISGCDGGPPIVDHSPAFQYFVKNLHHIMYDAANGGGESLLALSQMWGFSEEKYQTLRSSAKTNFHSIFGQDQKPANDIYKQLFTNISKG